MKIICISVGTRGDIEPFLAIAEICRQYGHDVTCAFPAQFRDLVEGEGHRFHPLTKEFLDMLNSTDGKTALGGGESVTGRLRAYVGLYRQNKLVSYKLMQEQEELLEKETPDLVLHSLKAMYPVYWHLQNPGKVVLISPVPCVLHPVDHMSSIALLGKDYGRRINRWSYGILRKLSMRYAHRQLGRMGHRNITVDQLVNSWMSMKMIYTISPILYPPQTSWPAHVKVVGYQERDKMKNWRAPAVLESFLKEHPDPLFITFGSMTNPDPEGKTDHILHVLAANKIPAIINTAGGGLVKRNNTGTQILFLEEVPYDWIFPRVRAVIHHGGAGTTHLALKYGCASMIIPHIPDQHLWNRILSNLEMGPRGVPVSRVTTSEFEKSLLQLYQDERFRNNAMQLSAQLQAEDFSDLLTEFLGVTQPRHA